jgi:hypothetical protein
VLTSPVPVPVRQCRARPQAPCSPGWRLIRGRALAPRSPSRGVNDEFMGFPWDPSGARASRFSHRDVSGWLEFLPRPNLELAHWRFRTMPNRTHANFKRLAEFACGLTSPATMPCFLRPLPRVQKALGAWAGSYSAAAALLCHASETFLRASHCVRKNPLRARVVAAGLVSCRPSLLFVSRPEVRVPGVALQRRSGAMRMICAVPSLPGEPNFTSPQTTNQH